MTKIKDVSLAGTAFVAVAQAADMASPLRGPAIVPSVADPIVGQLYPRGDVGGDRRQASIGGCRARSGEDDHSSRHDRRRADDSARRRLPAQRLSARRHHRRISRQLEVCAALDLCQHLRRPALDQLRRTTTPTPARLRLHGQRLRGHGTTGITPYVGAFGLGVASTRCRTPTSTPALRRRQPAGAAEGRDGGQLEVNSPGRCTPACPGTSTLNLKLDVGYSIATAPARSPGQPTRFQRHAGCTNALPSRTSAST